MQHQFLKARSARLVRGSASLAALALAISLAPSVAHAQRITQGGGNGANITGRTIGQGGIAGGGGGASRGTGGSAAQTPDGTASAGGISSGGAAGGQPGTPNDIAAGGGGTGGSSAGATGGDGGAGNLVTATGNFAFSIDYVGGDGGIGAGSGSGASAGGGGAGLVLTGANVQVMTQGYDVTGGNGGRGSGQGSGGGGGAALVLLNGGSITVGGGTGGAFSTITGGIGQEYGGSGAGIFLYDGGTLTIRNGNKVTGGEGGTFTTDGGTGGAAVLSNLGTVVNEGAIAGGEGGYGYSRGGRAGDGVQAWGGTVENSATGTIIGGRGGYNNSSIGSNYTGNGGAGVRLLDGQAATLTNAGEINGGAGGPRYAFGTRVGAGGMGVVGAEHGGSTIINSGIIRGGVNASSQRNLAIGLYGDNNRLELRAGSYMDGGVVVQAGVNNVLALGGSADSTFVVTEIGSTASFNYYLGFDTYEKSGTSTWTLTGTGNQDWRITGGNLVGDTNSLGGNLTFTSAPLTSVVAFNQSFDGSYAGTISGTGTVLKMGSGTVTLTGSSSVDWAINQGGVIADASHFTGNAKILAGASLTFNQTGNASYAGTLLDSGDLHKTGAGRLTLTGDSSWLTGTTFVEEGTLTVNGRLGSSVTVGSGATLGGSGTVGKTLVESGGHLAPGNSIGTLNVVGGLTVAAGANLDFELGQPSGTAIFGISDRIVVSGGDLALDGTINLIQSGNPADGAAGIGYYRLISYTHEITSNTAVIGTTPGLSNVNYELLVGGGSVDLFISPSLIVGDDTLQHWQGGDGTWNAASTQWLNQGGTAPASWAGNYAVFKDDDGYVGGTITLEGAQSFLGLQFVDRGYVLQGGGQLITDAAGSEIRVLADSAEIASEITGTGALIKTEAGTLILSGTNSYSGGTTIQSGTLQIGNGGTTGSIAGNVANSGTLAFARSDATSFGGTISGTGAVRILSGTVTLTADNGYTGGTSIATGATLQLGNGGTAGGLTGNVANNGTLVFNRSNDIVFAGVFSGAGSIRQAGSGETELTGDSSGYTGTTTVAAGTLAVNGRLGGALTVLAAGRLQGTGTLGNTIVSGTIAPGNSIGTLNVAGNIVFNTGSTYEVEADATGLADRIVATGTATINGGTVSVLAGAGNYRPETNYLILHADGGITGTGRFGGVTSNLAFLDPSLSYDGNNVYLRLRRNDISFASIGATPNQRATGTATQALGWNSPVFAAAVNLSTEQARAAFDQLSGEIHASARTALIEDSRFLRDAATDRLRTADSGFAVWGNGFGSWGHWGSDGNAARVNRSINGFVLGADAPVLGKARLGIVGSYGKASFDTRAHSSSGKRESYEFGIYGGADLGAAAVRIGVSHGWHQLDTTRLVAFPGFSDSLKGERDARTTQVFGEFAYRIELGATRVEPFADFAHVRLSTDGITEKGGAAALRLASADSSTSFSTLGLRAAPSFSLGGAKLTARGTLGWRHAFGDVTPLSAMQFASGGDSFRIAGTPIARNAAALDTGIDIALTSRAVLGIAYGGQFGSGASDQSVRASFNLGF